MEFKPIKGYEGIYEACSDGTIWSCEGKTTYSNRHGRIRKRVWKRRKLKLQTQKRQRGGKRDKKVKLWKDGEMKTHLVSRLVATEERLIITRLWWVHYENDFKHRA